VLRSTLPFLLVAADIRAGYSLTQIEADPFGLLADTIALDSPQELSEDGYKKITEAE
jgi:hypothetical protein